MSELSKIAQNYANKLASLNTGLQHSHHKKLAENLAIHKEIRYSSII
jgi:hypothetical protein